MNSSVKKKIESIKETREEDDHRAMIQVQQE
jgi:hypothetical protein